MILPGQNHLNAEIGMRKGEKVDWLIKLIELIRLKVRHFRCRLIDHSG